MKKRTLSRLAAVQALYRYEGLSPMQTVAGNFIAQINDPGDELSYLKEMDRTFFKKLLEMTIDHLERVDDIITANLSEDWKMERLDPVLLAILRVGIAELMGDPATDSKVILNEYVDVAKSFFDERESGFVNKTLDTAARALRSGEFE